MEDYTMLWNCGCGITDGTPTKCDKHKDKASPKPTTDLHNMTGHVYGCECLECMQEYWLLKR